MKKFASIMLSLALFSSVVHPISVSYASSTNQHIAETDIYNDVLNDRELAKYEGIDLYKGKDTISANTLEEKELYNTLINRALESNGLESNPENISYIKSILEDTKNYNQDDFYEVGVTTYSARSKQHGLISTAALGSALDVAISAALTGLGGASVRALISSLGEAQAKRLVRSVVMDKVRNVLFRFGFSTAATKFSGAIFNFLMGVTNPGGAIANYIDRNDLIPSNGYIELT